MTLTLVAAREAGSIGTRNRKMPGTSYALPTWECITGGKLAGVENSVCHDCYAKDSEKMYPLNEARASSRRTAGPYGALSFAHVCAAWLGSPKADFPELTEIEIPKGARPIGLAE